MPLEGIVRGICNREKRFGGHRIVRMYRMYTLCTVTRRVSQWRYGASERVCLRFKNVYVGTTTAPQVMRKVSTEALMKGILKVVQDAEAALPTRTRRVPSARALGRHVAVRQRGSMV